MCGTIVARKAGSQEDLEREALVVWISAVGLEGLEELKESSDSAEAGRLEIGNERESSGCRVRTEEKEHRSEVEVAAGEEIDDYPESWMRRMMAMW